MPNLVLRRHVGESIVINGPCRVTLLATGNHSARIAVEAEPDVVILRSEIVGRAREHKSDPNPADRPDAGPDPAGPSAGPGHES